MAAAHYGTISDPGSALTLRGLADTYLRGTDMPNTKQADLPQKFWDRVERTGDHWIWVGGLTAGRPALTWKRKVHYGHRFAWEMHNGPIPPRSIVQRMCAKPLCVNPDHFRCIPKKHVGTLPVPTEKRCRHCDQTKTASEFPRIAQKSDGLGSYCTTCTRKRQRNWNLSKYGMGSDDYDLMFAQQSGVCAACGGPPCGKGNRLRVDHDHENGAVRALLCNGCNLALGHVKDNPERLAALIDYLKRYG